MTERLVIDRLGHRGDGIADTPQGTVYVPYALPGETVEVERRSDDPERARLLRVVTASGDRVAPVCPHFGRCGGCAVQHWARYAEWKRQLVADTLAQAGVSTEIEALIDGHGAGRRRAVLHARRGRDGALTVGFAAPRAHDVVPIDTCPVLAPVMYGAIDAARAIAQVLQGGKPLDIHVTATETGLDVDLRGSGPLHASQAAALAQVAETHRLARVTRHGELIAQRIPPTLTIGRATVVLPPGAFLQATATGESTLARLVLDHVGAAAFVADLFCGIGPFALRLVERARVTAIDNDPAAIAALRHAAAGAKGLKPLAVQVRDLFRRPCTAAELSGFDAVVFDPPRQGAQAQARELARSRVPIVVGVSCNPATFARDARVLIDGGYRIGSVTPIDQFRYSTHIELVARFER
jgi:23S rRNA (uracil1939-C5)-methyltransferase